MTKVDMRRLDEESLVQMVESPPKKRKGIQKFKQAAIGLCLVAIAGQNLAAAFDHSRSIDNGGFLCAILFCMTSLILITLAESQSQIQALLQLYKNQRNMSERPN